MLAGRTGEHWGSSGFANTDLDLQLKQHGIRRIVLTGLIANTCLEATGRFGMELGYHVTLVTDATSEFDSLACRRRIAGVRRSLPPLSVESLLPVRRDA